MVQVSLGPVPDTTSTVWVLVQPSPARRPLAVQVLMLVSPAGRSKKSLFSSPSWTWLITFCHSLAAGLPLAEIFSLNSG